VPQGIAGCALLYALVIWGLSTVINRLGSWLAERGLAEVAAVGKFVVPLVLAALIGVRLRSWCWIAVPPLVIVVMTLSYATYAFLTASPSWRREAGAGYGIAAAAALAAAASAALAAGVGVWLGKSGLVGGPAT
jgi:hypothetical protein